ncbi:hypothetical protein COM33_25070 [Bacillus toyonensis]|nr:hypothetical protein CN637_07555 [Bacillus toyonensis]PEN31202.1 hypothetical protein CN543_29195 [Bacillus toyonensis]PEO07790.1 hypothetical protein CN561_00410 [Bacillus toyonensis]PGD40470.1 hypothetical protein COM33_25070 [Bacillus toyonensis]PGE88986.1 hypothetical protein COM75_21505 [Bacillus toyonensis]
MIKFNYNTESYNINYNFNLTKEKVEIFWNHYLEDESQGQESYASPLLAKADDLSLSQLN